jgi:CRISPR-associated protein (TIGR02710 family)
MSHKVLFVTIGFGHPKKLEETVYTPAAKSIAMGNWDEVVLLPSKDTHDHAGGIRDRDNKNDIHIKPLPKKMQEYDADACYIHFERVIGEFAKGATQEFVVDITRGTKAMSAALMLAAFRHRIPRIRYIEGERDPANPGSGIIAGTERVRDVHAAAANSHRLLDEARTLFQHGAFAAAAVVLEQAETEDAAQIATVADFSAAWDRLDYKSADEKTLPQSLPPQWTPFLPSQEARQWVHQLARPVPPAGDCAEMAKRIRLLAADLTANGERRIRQQQYEDAVVRAYRTMELIGQARLFGHGLDSANLPAGNAAVNSLNEKLKRKGSHGFGVTPGGTLTAPRQLVARLLKELGDDLAPELLKLPNAFPLIEKRNQSILIHGFEPAGPQDEADLNTLYQEIAALLTKDHTDAANHIEVARSLNYPGE